MTSPHHGYRVHVPRIEDLPERILRDAPVVVVVGDAMLDRWWMGGSHRLSREAPVPIVEVESEVEAPGGAANAAMNLAALGARARLVAAVGADLAGERMTGLLATGGVDVWGVVRDAALHTVTKTRVVADEQVLVRADLESRVDGRQARLELAERLAAELAASLRTADALVVSDYGSGLLQRAVSLALEDSPRPRWVVLDAHDVAAWGWLHADVAVPNAQEAALLLGRPAALAGADRRVAVEASADLLLDRSGAGAVIVTLDRDGALLLRAGEAPVGTRATPVAERYASGAGDTFTATLAAALAVGADLETATRLAQRGADVATRHLGTSVCTAEQLVALLGSHASPVLSPTELAVAIRRDRDEGRRIVFTNGCFDVLHLGHTSYLRQASELGDRLVVGVNSDASVRRLKGPERPVNGEDDRAAVLAALECVDYVTVFDDDTPIRLLEELRPDVYVKGGDYSPEMLEETPVVRGFGGDVQIVGYVPAHSTTELVERIRAAERE